MAESNNEISIPLVTATEVKRMIDAGEEFNLIDVRNFHSYCKGHIKGAASLPLTELEPADMVKYLDEHIGKGDPIVLYCYNGSGSKLVADTLVKNGFTDVRVMKGGRWSWRFVPGHKALEDAVDMREGMGYGH